jgi:hypothetical protein
MSRIATSRLFWLGSSAAMIVLWLAGAASAAEVPPAPEIDPATAASGLALLAGGVLLLFERRRLRRR